MKKYFIIPMLAAIVACSSPANKYTVEGTIKGGKGEFKNAILERRDPLTGFQAIDTAEVSHGKFVFEGKIDEPGMFFIKVDESPRATIILEKGTINMMYHADSIMASTVSGTYNNEELMKFTRESMVFQKQLLEFRDKNKNRADAATATKDTAAFLQLRRELEVLREKIDSQAIAYNDKYIAANPKSFISALIVEDYSRRFYDNPERVEAAFKQLDPSLRKTRVGKSISDEIAKMKVVDVHEKAPNFIASTPEGPSASLYQSLGKVTIVDFWASWCGPCRRENPNMVKLYQDFHDKGLNIVAVSLDKDAAKWKEAIAKDGLTWTHVSHLKEWEDPIAKQYGVGSIPSTYVLNQFGVVVAKNLYGDKLRAKIEELLKDKPAANIKK